MSGLAFDAETHTYTYGHLTVPSVTTILRGVRLIDFDHVPVATLDRARERGTAVHQAVQYDMEGALDPASLDPELRPYVAASRAWRADSKFQPIALEYRLYHPVWVYAGTADLVGWLDGVPTVADWKTGSATDAVADIQLSAYAAALRQTPPPEWFDVSRSAPIQRLAIELSDTGRYTVHRYRSPRDFALFLQALSIYNEQARRGLRTPA